MTSVYFDPAVGGDGSIVSDDTNPVTGLGAGGHKTRFIPALNNIVNIAEFLLDNLSGIDKVFTGVNHELGVDTPLNGLQGYSLDDSVLLHGQSSSNENGIYLVKAGAWVRRPDAVASADFKHGKLIPVDNGKIFVVNVPDVFALGIDPLWISTSGGSGALPTILQSIANLSPTSASKLIKTTGVDSVGVIDITSVGEAILSRTVSLDDSFQGKSTALGALSTLVLTEYGKSLLELSSGSLALSSDIVPKSGGSFTGVVFGVTASSGDDSTKLATTEFVQDAIAGVGGSYQESFALYSRVSNAVLKSGGNISGITDDASGIYVTFTSNAVDLNYLVFIDMNAYITVGSDKFPVPYLISRRLDGFDINYQNGGGASFDNKVSIKVIF